MATSETNPLKLSTLLLKLLKSFVFILLLFITVLVLSGIIIIAISITVKDIKQLYIIVDKITQIFFALATIGVIIGIFYLLIKLYKRFSVLIGSTVYSRLISIGITSIIFYKSIKVLLIVPFYILFSFGYEQVNQLLSEKGTFSLVDKDVEKIKYLEPCYNYNDFSSFFDASRIEEVISCIDFNYLSIGILDSFKNWLQRILQFFMEYIKELFHINEGKGFKQIIIGLLLLFIIGNLSDYFFQVNTMDNKNMVWKKLLDYIQKYKVNILFVIIFSISAFLSFSSIVSIPIMLEGKNLEGITTEDFEKEINKIADNSENLDKTILDTKLDVNHIRSQLDSFKLSFQSLVSANKKDNDILNKYYLVLKNNETLYKNYNSTCNSWEILKEKYPKEIQNEKEKLLSEYKNSGLLPAAGKERVNYFHGSVKYLNNVLSDYKTIMEFNQKRIKTYQNMVQTYISDIFSFFNNPKELDYKYNTFYYNFINLSIPLELNNLRVNYENIRPLLEQENILSGIFGVLSNWLIRTRNSELALIAGMIGFGLLGAGIASIIRKRKSSDDESIFKDNIESTLIGGFSAALLIFLSVKGGSMMFFPGEGSEPNQYALFFLCIVGAVFSEKIWGKAKEYLDK